MRTRASTLIFTLGFAICLAMGGCSPNPVTGKSELALISTNQEVRIGEQQYVALQQVSGGPYVAEAEVLDYVDRVGKKLAAVSDRPDLPFEFVVVNHSIPNAWALPGGKIAVHRGLLTELESEAELAAVLAHEIVHVAARHGAQRVESGMLYQAGLVAIQAATSDSDYGDLILGGSSVAVHLVTQKYSRNMELEADHYGIGYMVRAGYDPRAAVSLQEKFVRLSKGKGKGWLDGLFASHPPSEERVARNRELVANYEPTGFVGKEEYQEGIAPLVASKEAYEAYDKGREALSKGDVKGARRFAETACQQYPKEALFFGLIGDVRKREGNNHEAISEYDNAIRNNGDYFYFLLQRGLAYHQLQQNNKARNDLLLSIKLLPTAEAHSALAKIELGRNNEQGARRHMQAAAEAGPAHSEPRAMLTRTEMRERPEKYLTTHGRVGRDGYLSIVVENRSMLAVDGIVVDVSIVDQAGRIRTSRKMSVSQRLPSGHQAVLDTDLNARLESDCRVVAKVLRAHPVG